MTITRANAEVLSIRRVGGLFAGVGLDGTTEDGTNVDLNGPIGWALRQLGETVADPVLVANVDLANLADSDLDEFLDLVELRCLESAFNAATALVDLAIGPRKESFSQTASRLEARISAKRDQLAADYGTFGSILESDVIQLNFAEHGTE